ncbi:hypothetical protein EYF80_012714 [Liparis tanakae]|uniref:Uncharacterized protein n=1 Tax=Liparis tanakae TaxID=230148 RepID=A0A4Z2IGE2_9TELE|nr:hypothetical protein EYF80_012714 [Liparis tanakae]
MMCTQKNHLFALPVLVLSIFISLLFNCFSPRHGSGKNNQNPLNPSRTGAESQGQGERQKQGTA